MKRSFIPGELELIPTEGLFVISIGARRLFARAGANLKVAGLWRGTDPKDIPMRLTAGLSP
jgi:hypothetical protein